MSTDDLGAESSQATSNVRKRRRAAQACNICRVRKIRCDGREPCETCSTTGQACAYGAEPNTQSKSDLILEGILRVEKTLQEMNMRNSKVTSPGILSGYLRDENIISTPLSYGGPETRSRHIVSQSPITSGPNIHNAILSSFHTSTTESVLEWSCFDHVPSIRQSYVSIFGLEQSRPPIAERTTARIPFVSGSDLNNIINSFQHSVNFWYPTMSMQKMNHLRSRIMEGYEDNTTTTCLAFLMMALGCASQSVMKTFEAHDPEAANEQQSNKAMADMYFDGALKRIHVAQMEVSSTANQCFLFVALYFAFLQRPLQAWSYINATAAKCRLLLAYSPLESTAEDEECTRRIFWSCYILESDYLAELSALPQSGIAEIESSIPLPGDYSTHENRDTEEQSSLYFLACLSMRRLLNRVHNLLYAKETGAGLDDARFPYIVCELDHQLEEWRELLPSNFQFTVDTQSTVTQHGGFLRQRYLTCRSVIYRPYLTWLLTNFNESKESPPNVLEKCQVCLDACLLHMLNLRDFTHTVMVDTWICSLSMTCAMLILLAAIRVPALRDLIRSEATTVGDHLQQLMHRWAQVPGHFQSPSVAQSLQMIWDVHGFIQHEYEQDDVRKRRLSNNTVDTI
ncbi:C6 zinc finger-containing protein [Coleophoma crateriformis]|uniref:C6 zinc finger-containing protein n=1 Tax=Coleophoma crateriformis TaxID=565419 RepID=A0A3D8S3Q8_9HELO|nr:C6 zinc finger-containing protein [Coleophoma crateriformis]